MSARFLFITLLTVIPFTIILSCNERLCGSVVTKCLLTKSCSCQLENCTCCRDCFACLGDSFDECCSCIDLCPKFDDNWNTLRKTSHVEDFSESTPNLFVALTDQPDYQNRWSIHSFPIDLDPSVYSYSSDIEIKSDMNLPILEDKPSVNCTVVFMTKTMSMLKCKASCKSMGAAKMRWFHDGCCECVGDSCVHYGLNESKCKENIIELDNILDTLSEDELDYGEDMDEEEDDDELFELTNETDF